MGIHIQFFVPIRTTQLIYAGVELHYKCMHLCINALFMTQPLA